MFAVPGPLRAPLFHRFPPPRPSEEGPSRARDRRRAPSLLAPDPRRVAARRRRSPPGTSGWSRWRGRGVRDGILVVEAPEATRPWVAERFGRLLQACAAAVLGPGVQVDLVAAGAQPSRRRAGRVHTAAGPRPGVQPAAHVRAVRHRRLQPPRPRRRAGRRRAPGPRLQPALHLRAARPRQDPPAALDRATTSRAYGGGSTVRYTTAEAFTNHFLGALHGARHRALQGRLPRRRRPARRRRPVPPGEGAHRGGVLPHLQRAPPGRRADRAHVRPPAARHRRRSRSGCASASRPGSSPTSRSPDPATRLHDPAQARPAGRASRALDPAALELIADRVTDNVRALEGALIRVVAFGSLTGRPVDRRAGGGGPRRPLSRPQGARPHA